jgi:hypothetical protein
MKPAIATAALLLAMGAMPAFAVNKCLLQGKTVFQDAPCDEQRETVAEGRERQKRIQAYHAELDQLAAQGHGLRREAPAAAKVPEKRETDTGDGMFKPKTRSQIRAERDAAMARHQEESERRNAESAARLTRMLDEAGAQCGGDPKQVPAVGMSDELFRTCTLHARFGGVRQVVAVERDGKPLRLYLFSNAPQRVYSVDGVVTAIRP